MMHNRDSDDELEFTFEAATSPEDAGESVQSDDDLVMLDGSAAPPPQTDEQEGVRDDLSHVDNREDEEQFRPATLRADPTGEFELNLEELTVGSPAVAGPSALEEEPPADPEPAARGLADLEPYLPEDRSLPLDEVELHTPEEPEVLAAPREAPPELTLQASRRRELRRSLRERKDSSERRFGTARLKTVPSPKKRLVWVAMVLAMAGAGVVWWLLQ